MDHTLRWQKSTFSDGGEGDAPATQLTTGPTPLAHLIRGLRSGRFATN